MQFVKEKNLHLLIICRQIKRQNILVHLPISQKSITVEYISYEKSTHHRGGRIFRISFM